MGKAISVQPRMGPCQDAFDRAAQSWDEADGTRRVWDRDASLWTDSGEDRWLAWLDAVDTHRQHVPAIESLVASTKADGMTDVLLLGMGGSSLCPEVVAETFGPIDGHAKLHVLDSTVPDQVRRFRSGLDLSKTLVIVASKSGSTVEPNVLLDYVFEELSGATDTPGRHVVAVTDPASDLEKRAAADGYREVFAGVPEIGGRFSALSNFGLLPAGLAGVDLAAYLDRADEMSSACRSAEENPGVTLGAALGGACLAGRDKLTLVVSPRLWDIGAWIEQLIAESTGKQGKGICPVDGEPELPVSAYGDDRVFVYIRLADGASAEQDARVESLVEAGHPVVTVELNDAYDLGAAFYLWEFATAVVGALLEINPFDQPNVQESKDITSEVLAAYERDGTLPEPAAVGAEGAISVTTTGTGDSPVDAIARFVQSIGSSDYFSIAAFCDRTDLSEETFGALRLRMAEAKRVATTLGYGPRFLHSTGQLHKGGANNGAFLQVTTAPDADLDIPGKAASFGVLSRAQAVGDYRALAEKGRRVLRLDLSDGLDAGLREARRLIEAAI